MVCGDKFEVICKSQTIGGDKENILVNFRQKSTTETDVTVVVLLVYVIIPKKNGKYTIEAISL